MLAMYLVFYLDEKAHTLSRVLVVDELHFFPFTVFCLLQLSMSVVLRKNLYGEAVCVRDRPFISVFSFTFYFFSVIIVLFLNVLVYNVVLF